MPETPIHPQADRAALPDRIPHQRRTAYLAIWPLGLLIVAELLAALLLHDPAALPPLATLLSMAVLLAGIIPAFLQPSPATNLLGCLSVVLASALWHSASMLQGHATLPDLVSPAARLALINYALLAPVIVQIAAKISQQGMPSSSGQVTYSSLMAVMILALFALPAELHAGALAALVLTTDAGFLLAGYQLVRVIQHAHPAYPRAAQQARLLLLSLIVAETPLLLLPIGRLIQLDIPIQFVLGAQMILPIGVAYAIIRPDVLGIDVVLRRMLDYATVAVGLLIAYIGLNALLMQVNRQSGGTWIYVMVIFSIIPVAAALPSLHRRTQHITDRLFYPERIAFIAAISKARTTLSLVVQRDAIIQLLEHELPHQLGASWASLALRPSFVHPANASQPGAWSMLLIVSGQPLGCYWLGPRYSGLSYAADEQEQLRGIIQQAALALAYAETVDTLVQLNQELEERVSMRTEHVLAQQRELATFEERQRLARDLHDSVKQTLFSLGLGLRSARARIHSDPNTAIALLQQQEQAAIQAQAEMGDLLAQLRTPMNETADLVAILEEHTTMLAQQHGLYVQLELPPALVLPEPLPRELAQIAREALHNVLRHSAVSEVQLNITIDQGQLTMVIMDQGCGFDSAIAAPGHGLRGIRERVEGLGGALKMQSSPGKGTTVWVQINLNR